MWVSSSTTTMVPWELTAPAWHPRCERCVREVGGRRQGSPLPWVAVTYLDRILAAHRAAATDDGRVTADLVAMAAALPAPRGFTSRLRSVAAAGDLAVIAEVKRHSPSK